MAITIDTGNISSDVTAGVSSVTLTNHVVSSGTDLLIVGVSMKFGTISVSSVYWNTTEQLASIGSAQEQDDAHAELFYLVNPTATTADVVVTLSGTLGGSNGIVVGAIGFDGVDTGDPLGTVATATTVTTVLTVDVSSASGQLVIDCVSNKSLTFSADGGQTERWNLQDGSDSGGCSTEAGAATVTMSWTQAGSIQGAIVGVGIKPAEEGEERDIAGSLPAMAGALDRTFLPNREIEGVI